MLFLEHYLTYRWWSASTLTLLGLALICLILLLSRLSKGISEMCIRMQSGTYVSALLWLSGSACTWTSRVWRLATLSSSEFGCKLKESSRQLFCHLILCLTRAFRGLRGGAYSHRCSSLSSMVLRPSVRVSRVGGQRGTVV